MVGAPLTEGNVSSQISGQIIKRNPSLSHPTRLAIAWINVIEGHDIRDGTAWNRIGGQSILESSGDFSLKMEMTNSELVNNITTHQKILQRWSEKLTLNQTEQFKNIKFAMGLVFGIYNEDPPNDIIGAFNEKGPNGEKAYSDMYAVFYRSEPIDVMLNFLSQSKGEDLSCRWWAQLPQGFSCGRGAAKDPACGRWERYVPTDCSNIIVKVSDKKCQKYYCPSCENCYENNGYCEDYEKRMQHPDLGNKEDCFTSPNVPAALLRRSGGLDINWN